MHALAELQNSLGHINDIAVADHLFERIVASREHKRTSRHLCTAAGLVAGWHTHSASNRGTGSESHLATVPR